MATKDEVSGRLMAAAAVLLLVALGLKGASGAVDGWGLLYASIGCLAVGLLCIGVVLWRNRDRL